MILVDTSVWIDHFRSPINELIDLLNEQLVLTSPFTIGEIALGSIKDRQVILTGLDLLPKSIVASDEEVLTLIERKHLFGLGIGYGDAHLLASTLLTQGATLWTFDRRLHLAAEKLGCAADLPGKQTN